MNKSIQVNLFSLHLFRICLSGIFITAGISHLIAPDKVVGRIQAAQFGHFAELFGNPYLLGILSGYALLIGGILFLLGILTRWSALLLFMVFIPITITIQMGNGIAHGPLWKNIALFGGLLFFIINNPKTNTFLTNKFKKS